MDNIGTSAMQFGNWASLPSISETFNKTSKGEFNPLAAALGYGISKVIGDNDLTRGLQSQGAQLPPTLQTGPSIPQSVPPSVASPASQLQPQIEAPTLAPTNTAPATTFNDHPLLKLGKQLLGG